MKQVPPNKGWWNPAETTRGVCQKTAADSARRRAVGGYSWVGGRACESVRAPMAHERSGAPMPGLPFGGGRSRCYAEMR